MSNEYINGVIVHSRAKRSARAVLLVLANRANGDGLTYPGLATIADEAGVSERTATRALAALIELGELEIAQAGRQHQCPQYRIKLAPEWRAQGRQIVTSDEIQGRQIVPQGRQIVPQGRQIDARGDKLSEPTYTRDLEPNEPTGEPEREPRAHPPRPVFAEATSAAPAPIQNPRTPGSKTTMHRSPHLDARRFENGYIPPGAGRNAVEVYYERFSINEDPARLNAIQEDDLVRGCPDLVRLREVIIAYSRTAHRKGNIQLILDWYRRGAHANGNGAPAANGLAPPPNGRESNISYNLRQAESLLHRLKGDAS